VKPELLIRHPDPILDPDPEAELWVPGYINLAIVPYAALFRPLRLDLF
jgi:hypothetical protein